MRRVSFSRLAVALACPGSHRDDTEWVKDPPTWAMRGGLGFHAAIEVYPAEPDYAAIAKKHNLTARMLEIIKNQHAQASKWLARKHRASWENERAFAYDPTTGTARDLARGDFETKPGEWYTRLDVVDPHEGYLHDWKAGRRPMPPPRDVPQVWGSAVVIAQRFGFDHVTAAVVQVGEDALEESAQRFDRTQIGEAREQLRLLSTRLVPDAPYITGEHCSFCPAKKKCAAYAAAQREAYLAKKKEETPMTTTTPNNVRPIASARMALKSITTGATRPPVRILIHGPEKLGKSTLAMGAPSPVFIPFDNGLDELGPARFPRPESFDELLAAIAELKTSEHSFKTLVIDPVNLAESQVFAKVCEEYGKANIDEVLGGFNKGQTRSVKYWEQLTVALDDLRETKKMHIILVSHTAVRNQKNPEAQDWGSWQPAMEKNGGDFLKRWVDAIVFGRFEEFAKTIDGKVKGRSTGARVLLTQPNAAYAAGNRFSLPPELPLSWGALWDAIEHGRSNIEELRGRARAMAKEMGSDVLEKCERFIADAGPDVNKLAEIINALELKKQSA